MHASAVAGCIAVKKVKFDAKQEYEFIENFKLLQSACNKKGVDKVWHRASGTVCSGQINH